MIKQAIIDQKHELEFFRSGTYVERKVPETFIRSNLVKVISGVRRSGKSTLAHLILRDKSYAYINFDDERLISLRPEQLNEVLEHLYLVYGDFEYLLIDEVQNMESWSLFVNRLARQGINMLITGSNSKLLSREIATHLTGRYVGFELFPFSFLEYLDYKNIQFSAKNFSTKENAFLKSFLDDYMQIGGFPEIAKGEDPIKYATELFFSIVSRDILLRYKIKYQRTFKDIALYLVNNYAREVSYNRIKNIFKLGSEHTAKNYIDYLEEAYLVFLLSKFSFKRPDSLKYRKCYVIDMSFLRALSADFAFNRGYLLENMVAIELFRRRSIDNFEIFYYKKNVEVDFVLRKQLNIIELIQVSYNINEYGTMDREVKALMAAAHELNPVKMTIITSSRSDTLVYENRQITITPILNWLIET